MKPYTIVILAMSMTIFSCREKQNTTLPVANDLPEAFKEDKVNLKNYSRSAGNIVQELYAELAEQDPALKQLEEDFNTYSSHPGDLNQLFENYNEKSLNYYASAHNTTDMISDSSLRKKMADVISLSNERYLKKITHTNDLLKHLSENNLSLNDHHTVLKIALTLPLIEKYQSGNALKDKLFKDLIKEQENLLKQTDKQITLF